MTTTRIHFELARSPDGVVYTQFRIEAPGLDLPHVTTPALKIADHRAVFDAFDAGGEAGQDRVRAVGDALWNCLSEHDNSAAAFHPTLSPAALSPSVRLTFSGQTGDAKALPWEALHEAQGGFLSFDRRIPILREIETGEARLELKMVGDTPLRFFALIAARGNDGRGEWRALYRALQTVPDDVPFEVLVLASRQALQDEINALNDTRVRAEPVPESAAALVARVERFGPQIAHWFCHGFAGAPSCLEIENWEADIGGANPTWLTQGDLVRALSGAAWVVVLSACSLADLGDDALGTPETVSLCEDLVHSGIPIVIGMRGPMNAGYANAFGGAFHHHALMAITQAIQARRATLDLGAGFADACRDILATAAQPPSMAANEIRDWTFPVMTLRGGMIDLSVVGSVTADVLGGMMGGRTVGEPTDMLGRMMRGATVAANQPDAAALRREELLGELSMYERTLEHHAGDLSDSVKTQIRERIDALHRALGEPGAVPRGPTARGAF